MKTTSAFMAVCTALLMFSCSGDDENSQSTTLQLKTTTSSPAKGEIGTKITIIGENFTDQAKVYLKNAKATITSVTATQLQVIAPANEAGECIIEVMVGAQKTENLRFTYVDYTPVVSSISPSSGTENTEITIIGENFSTTPEENIVKIGDAIATVKYATETELKIIAPQNEIGTYAVTVSVGVKTGKNPALFTYEDTRERIYECTQNFITVPSDINTQDLKSVTFLKDGRLAYSTNGGSATEAWAIDLRTMEREKIVPNGTGTVLLKITTNPTNGKLYLAYKGEDKISVWDPNTKQVSDLLTRNGLDNLMDVKFDQYNNMYAVCRNSGTIQKYPSGNYNSSSRLEFVKITGRQIQAIAFDAAGNLIAAATDGSNAGYIYKVDSSGAYTLIAGGGNKVITEDITEDPKTAKLEKAEGLMVDKDGYIWFSDGNSGTRKTKILKPGKNGYQDATIILVCKAENGWKDSGTTSPVDFVQDTDGTIYIADGPNKAIHKVTIGYK